MRRFLQIARQDLDARATPAEEDRLVRRATELACELARLLQRVRAQSRNRVEHRRHVDAEVTLARRRAVLVDDRDVAARQRLRVLRRVAQRRGAEQEARLRAVVPRDAHDAAQHVRDARAEHSRLRVHLVDDDPAQRAEELRPLRVVGQDARVEHPRVRHHEMPAIAQRAAHRWRRVTVVRVRVPALPERFDERRQSGGLVLRQSLRRIEEQCARFAVGLEQRLQDGQRVAERLARCGRRRDEHVAPVERELDETRLVCIELFDAARAVELDEPRIDARRERRRARRARWDDVPALETRAPARVPLQCGDEVGDAALRPRAPLAAVLRTLAAASLGLAHAVRDRLGSGSRGASTPSGLLERASVELHRWSFISRSGRSSRR